MGTFPFAPFGAVGDTSWAKLIEKILVHQTEKINGKKIQEIDIYYRGVGIISFPVSLEDMTMLIEKIINKRISA